MVWSNTGMSKGFSSSAPAPAAESRRSLSLRSAPATPGDGRAIPTPAHDIIIGGLVTSTFLTVLVAPVRCD